MAWYVMFDALSIEDLPSGGGNVGMQRLRDSRGTAVVPLFTTEERYWNFIEECEFDGTSMKPFPMPFDIFRLGELLRPLAESEERHLVAVDPFVVGEDWESLARLCSVEEFCLFLKKFHPVAKGLAEEGLAEFGDAPEQAEKIMNWMQPQLNEKVGDVLAVVREHLVEEER
jgi:hypothetical protein